MLTLYVHALSGIGTAAVVNTVSDRVTDAIENELAKQRMGGMTDRLVGFGVFTGVAALALYSGDKIMDLVPGNDPLDRVFFILSAMRSRTTFKAYQSAVMIVEDIVPRSLFQSTTVAAKKPCCDGCAKSGGSCGGK